MTLAVQGKLVAQDPSDEPASELLKKIRAEKDRLIAAKALKREKDEPALTEDALPFALPVSWSWSALGEVIDIVRGITFPATQKTREAAPGRIACLRTSNVQQTIEWEDLLFVDRSFMGREDQLIQHHDIVMSMANSRELVGKVALIEHIPHAEATFGGFLGVLRPRKIDPRYAMAVLRTPYARSLLIDSSSQTTNIANVSLAKLRPLPFPLPPEAEQSRIVTRVEELMRLCDALEAKGQLEAAQHAQLVSTLLATLSERETPAQLNENWHRIATHFDLLLDRPAAVDALEQTILQLAVRGLLVPQDPQDEPASELLKKIRAEKDKLIAEGKIKRGAPLPPITEDEQPFVLPHGWEFVRLIDLMPEFQNGASSRGDAGGQSTTVLRLADIKGRRISLADTRQIQIKVVDIKKYQLVEGDILITRVNGSADIVGQFNLCDQAFNAIYCDHFIRMRIDRRWIAPDFCALLGESELIRASIKNLFTTTAGQKTVNQGHIGSLTFGLPPLAEQSRIVTRVAQLRRLCADLRQRLAASQSTQAHLAEALVQNVV
ncbi:MAG: restriction endonuclease subunit S [Rhodoferax sp.]